MATTVVVMVSACVRASATDIYVTIKQNTTWVLVDEKTMHIGAYRQTTRSGARWKR
jgi:hypothetical protein